MGEKSRALEERALLALPPRVYRRPKETHARRATRDDERESEREMPSFDNPMSPGGDDETLSRSYTKSSKKELLKQIRDAVNPNQRRQNVLLIAQAGLISAATIILAIFALLALFEILKLDKATTTITSNLDAIIASLSDIQKGVNESYEATPLMPLLLDMNEQTKYIEGNLSITVEAMINSPVLAGGLIGRR